MNAKEIERAAYIAAHQILTTDLQAPELACPGARRSYSVDAIAGIIKGVFEARRGRVREAATWSGTGTEARESAANSELQWAAGMKMAAPSGAPAFANTFPAAADSSTAVREASAVLPNQCVPIRKYSSKK